MDLTNDVPAIGSIAVSNPAKHLTAAPSAPKYCYKCNKTPFSGTGLRQVFCIICEEACCLQGNCGTVHATREGEKVFCWTCHPAVGPLYAALEPLVHAQGPGELCRKRNLGAMLQKGCLPVGWETSPTKRVKKTIPKKPKNTTAQEKPSQLNVSTQDTSSLVTRTSDPDLAWVLAKLKSGEVWKGYANEADAIKDHRTVPIFVWEMSCGSEVYITPEKLLDAWKYENIPGSRIQTKTELFNFMKEVLGVKKSKRAVEGLTKSHKMFYAIPDIPTLKRRVNVHLEQLAGTQADVEFQ